MWIIAAFVGLLLLVSVLVYMPPVQNLIKDKTAQILSENTGMHLTIGQIRLKFPLRLSIDNTTIITTEGDTLVHVGSLKTGVAIAPLFHGEIVVPGLRLKDVAANYRDSISNMQIIGTLGSLTIDNTSARLSKERLNVGSIAIKQADISLNLGESKAMPDTTATDTTSAAWSIALQTLGINDVQFRMHTAPDTTELTASVATGRLQDLLLDLGKQEINLNSLRIDNGSYAYLTDTTSVSAPSEEQSPQASAEPVSKPWTVRLARLELNDNSARYGTLHGEPAEGFDPSHIETASINLRIDSVFNRGSAISADIVSLTLLERSGLEITETSGRFSMDSSAIILGGFELHTPSSRIKADAKADATLLAMEPTAKLSADLTADISAADAFILYPADASTRNSLRKKTFSLNSRMSGTLGNITVGTLQAQMPGHIDLRVKGNVKSVTAPDNLAGNLSLSGTFRNLDIIKGFLPDSTSGIGFPEIITLNGTIAASGNEYAPHLILTADSGRMEILGNLNTRSETYTAELTIDKLPLGTFLPHDSLGLATLSLSAKGNSFNPTGNNTAAEISAAIDRFDYNGYDFSDISLNAALKEHILSGNLSSKSDALQFDLDIGGELRDSLYAASIKGVIGMADIEAIGFASTPLSVSLAFDASASAQTIDSIYNAAVTFDSVSIKHGVRTERIGLTTIKASADSSSVTAGVASGDLKLDFKSSESITSIANGFNAAARILASQIDSLDIDMRPIREALPAFRLDFSAQRKNPLREYLYTTGVDFNKVALSTGNGPKVPVAAGIIINGLRTGGMTLDTLNVWLGQYEEKLVYGLRLRNRPGNMDKMAFIGIGGSLSGKTMSANLRQRDRADSTGFQFGITAELLDSAVRATLTPINPVFGYRKWSVNKDNYFTFHFDKRMEADLRLEGSNADQYFRITSVERDSIPPGSVRFDISGINIGEALALFPAPPPAEGILGGSGSVCLSGDIIRGDLTFAVDNLKYAGNKVGNIALGATANTSKELWELDLFLSANDKTALSAKGTYDVANTGAIDMNVSIPDLQLNLANAFLPADMARLSGTANGELKLTGTIDRLGMKGGLAFKDARLTVPMIGTTYKISDQRITIDNGRVNFNEFGLIAPNNQKLSLDGNVDIRDFSAMRADLELFAANFEAVNSSRSGGSQIYGVAALDTDIRLRGPIDALVIRGNVNLLSRTNIYYTMRDSPLEVEDAKQDIVTFVSFADVETWVQQDSVPLRRQSSIDMLVNVDVQDNVRATVNLSENGNNRIELAGDGALTYSMNSQGDTRLTGRYTLSGGSVVYKLPVISQKTFDIDDGSYVEWTGELAEPSFNITATEPTQVRILQTGGDPKMVTFNVIVSIKNSLENMALTFDLEAPSNSDIQTELENMTAEERSSKAIYMLITNQYVNEATGTESQSAGFDINEQIGDFISKELNQWARNNLKGVELSVGIDTIEDGTGTSHTDYSYSVSKSLFNDRFKVTIGGSVTDDPTAESTTENIVDDISIEYRLTKRDNMFIKVYRYNTQESILEGEIVETGAGFVLRKKMNRIRELFRLIPDPAIRRERQKAREERRKIREEELEKGIDPARRQNQGPLIPTERDSTVPAQVPAAATKDDDADAPRSEESRTNNE